jgi:hypothetical protein
MVASLIRGVAAGLDIKFGDVNKNDHTFKNEKKTGHNKAANILAISRAAFNCITIAVNNLVENT